MSSKKVRFVSCWNADDPSTAEAVAVVTRVGRDRYDAGMQEMNRTGHTVLFDELQEEFLTDVIPRRISGSSIGNSPWICRGCSRRRADQCVKGRKMTVQRHGRDRSAANYSRYAFTMQTPILVPCCDSDSCYQTCKDLCDTFNRSRLVIDKFNTGIPVFSNFYSRDPLVAEYEGEPGQKPVIVYSARINGDQAGGGYVQRVPIYKLPADDAPLLQSVTANEWDELSTDRKERILKCAEGWGRFMILRMGLNGGHNLRCRECNLDATYFASGMRSVACIADESVFVSTDILIPVCSDEIHSRCCCRAFQRVDHWRRTQVGERVTNQILYQCLQCGVEETPMHPHVKCRRCKVAFYCSQSCQREHWRAGHKDACQPWPYDTNPDPN